VENQVEEIKKKLDIVEVIQRMLPLKKRGRHFVACCPFHQEKTPSFVVSPELQIYKCFGCGRGGDIFSFYQEFNRVDFREALEDLAKIAGIKLVHSGSFSKEEIKRKNLYNLNLELARFYHYILMAHDVGKESLKYLEDRGIKRETIKRFVLGFSPPDSRLAIQYLTKKGFKIEDLFDSGSFGKSQYKSNIYDRFSGRIIFPQIDFRERVVGFAGRILPSNKNPDLAKYINSPETAIYHKSQMFYGLNVSKEAIKNANVAIIVEGELDMISPFQSGVENVVAIKGTALTEEQLQLIRRYADTIILGLDSDFAGNKASIRSIELADKMDFEIKVLDLEGKFKDPDEAVRNDLNFFIKKIKKAESVWDFILNSSVSTYGADSPRGKKLILSTILPFLTKINNKVIQSDYLRKVAQAIGSEEESVVAEFEKYLSVKKINEKIEEAKNEIQELRNEEQGGRIQNLENRLMEIILRLRKPQKMAKEIKWESIKLKKIAEILAGMKNYSGARLAAKLPPELLDGFNELYLRAMEDQSEAEERKRERDKILKQLEEIHLKEKLKKLSGIIAHLEASKKEKKIVKIEAEYAQTLKRLAELQRA